MMSWEPEKRAGSWELLITGGPPGVRGVKGSAAGSSRECGAENHFPVQLRMEGQWSRKWWDLQSRGGKWKLEWSERAGVGEGWVRYRVLLSWHWLKTSDFIYPYLVLTLAHEAAINFSYFTSVKEPRFRIIKQFSEGHRTETLVCL